MFSLLNNVVFVMVAIAVTYIFVNKKFEKLNSKIIDLQDELQRISQQINTHALNNDINNQGLDSLDSKQPDDSTHHHNFDTTDQPSSLSQDDSSITQPLITKTVNSEASSTFSKTIEEALHSEQPLQQENIYHGSVTQDSASPGQSSKSPSRKSPSSKSKPSKSRKKRPSSPRLRKEPDEQSTPIVTSVMQSLKNWFFGGNLVVRVGAIVLLMGVILLLRLLSEYFETPIEIKLLVIGVIGLVIAGLGFKLVKKRYTYGITLQGAGLAIAYLTTYFGYQVYDVLPSLHSFIILGSLSVITVLLAVKQNAFPLALLAFSGAFLAPLLTSNNSGSLTTLFSYYLLLNAAIAVIAHYRTWKVLNLLAATITFGFAYYLGLIDLSTINHTEFNSDRWQLVLLITLHWLLYVFVVIRYTQQLLKYNEQIAKSHYLESTSDSTQIQESIAFVTESNSNKVIVDNEIVDKVTVNKENLISDVNTAEKSYSRFSTYKDSNTAFIIPIDVSLMFGVPLLAFGLFSILLNDIDNALTIVSAIMSAAYLCLGAYFVVRDKTSTAPKRYTPLIEGMLALGFGFLALMLTLAFDTQWTACGWLIQGLGLVWFGRHSLRAWSVIAGVILQALAIASLFSMFNHYNAPSPSTLSLSISAICCMASAFILRYENSPTLPSRLTSPKQRHLLDSINTQNPIFKMIWSNAIFVGMLCFVGIVWTSIVTFIIIDEYLAHLFNSIVVLISVTILLNLVVYLAIEKYRVWNDVRILNHGLMFLFYLTLILATALTLEDYRLYETTPSWLTLGLLIGGWLVVGQLWMKRWYDTNQCTVYDRVGWLVTGAILTALISNHLLPDSNGVIPVLIIGIGLVALTYLILKDKLKLPSWFDWQSALVGSAVLFIPLSIGWTILSNWDFNGIVWNLPYIPMLNLYDMSLLIVLAYLIGTHYLSIGLHQKLLSKQTLLLKIAGILSFWVLSSVLIRTLHTYIGTPLWNDGAWFNDQVQSSLTILWTLTALIATFMSSKNGKRFWWFMGIGLLAIVVLKLVVVDLSQTDAIWRVVSFLGAGSLILLIGYLAPLPPEEESDDLPSLPVEGTDTES